MKTKMKRFLSVVLVLIMSLSIALPAIAADDQSEKVITIYIEGFNDTLYKNGVIKEEDMIYHNKNFDFDIDGLLKEHLLPIVKNLSSGLVDGNYDKYCDELYNAVMHVLGELKLDENGEASNGTGTGVDMLKDAYEIDYSVYPGGKIVFIYDWRLSLQYTAGVLEQFIERVCKEQNVEKVNIIGRCLGANIVSTYLETTKNINRVNDIVYYMPSALGLNLIGAIFSGTLVVDPESMNAFLDYYIDTLESMENSPMKEVLSAMVYFFQQIQLLGIGLDLFQRAFDNIKDDLFPRTIRDTFGSFPSFWAMVPDKYFDKALNYCYGTPELKAQYAKHIEKIVYYHDNVKPNVENKLKELEASGHRVMVIAKYNIPQLPIIPETNLLGDGFSETTTMSFGATTADYGKNLKDSYINEMSEEDKKYLSPDQKIDASTCLFPETTWFIKNLHHNHFPKSVDILMSSFISNENMTVFTDSNYPQYLEFFHYEGTQEDGDIKPLENVVEDELPVSNTIKSMLYAIIRFFKSIISLLTGGLIK